MLSRRDTLLGALALGACAPQQAGPPATAAPLPTGDSRFEAIEQRIGGRVGVAAWNTADNAWLVNRPQERFAMCSTFKWVLAAHALYMAEHGGPQLEQQVRFDQSDMLSHAPRTEANLARGWMTIEELCAAVVEVSDNPAANLLLELQMGPDGLTRFLRANGDAVTRLDRTELALNENAPDDPRDTTTPDAMARTMQRFLLTDEVLAQTSRDKLIGWLVASTTGLQRLRAGLPADWSVGDKTGTGRRGAVNDLAVIWPPGRAPIVVACYLSGSERPTEELSAAHAEVARIVAETWS